ncbi:MAG: hypothetical protein QOK40_1000 [Miltoncostaeaceae bacterium]|jgi:hypothetical protein|nr:hypothetical protein [Miltoncostaeaceae bacterium]
MTGAPGDMPAEGGPREPTPEEMEMAAAFVAQLGRAPVRDILFQAIAQFHDVAAIRLGRGPEGDEVRDLEQARLAIEAMRALLAVVEEHLGAALTRPFKEPLARLQLTYAGEAEGAGAGAGGEQGGGDEPPGPGRGTPPPPPPPDDPSGRIWTPPGYRK